MKCSISIYCKKILRLESSSYSYYSRGLNSVGRKRMQTCLPQDCKTARASACEAPRRSFRSHWRSLSPTRRRPSRAHALPGSTALSIMKGMFVPTPPKTERPANTNINFLHASKTTEVLQEPLRNSKNFFLTISFLNLGFDSLSLQVKERLLRCVNDIILI